ncbi:acyl carrier protein [Parafrankia sp. EUN1f]|uniref:acyl carrier protein n=1 Tax=Parafrankia sp. EUN1f TaxID=102897 RepID=UPI00055D4B06|nr:acyl carrier protein [Parafrankia sp. EUN1f]
MTTAPGDGTSPATSLSEADLLRWLSDQVAASLGLDPAEIDIDQPLVDLGLSSRDAVAMTSDLEDLLDTALEPTLLWQHTTLAALARRLAAPAPAAAPAPPPQPALTPTRWTRTPTRWSRPCRTRARPAPTSAPAIPRVLWIPVIRPGRTRWPSSVSGSGSRAVRGIPTG